MGKNGGKWGEKGEEMGRKWGERGLVAPPKFPYFPPFSPIFPPFSPIFPCHGYIVGTFVGMVPATGAGYF